MKILQLIKAFRASENIVKVLYHHNPSHQEFVIEWCNIQPDGEIGQYHLQEDECLSESERFNNLLREAINAGQTGKGDDDLYLELRDTFDALDCESLT